MADGFRWKPVLRVDQCGSTKEVLCLSPWSQDGWPSFRLAISLYPPSDIYRLLLAHWASHALYSLSFLIALLTLSHRVGGPFSVCMHHCLGVSWALDLVLHSPHYILYMFATLHFHLTSLVVLFVSSYLFYLLLICIIFFHLEWWSSSVHYMEGSHVISTIYPMDTDLGILSLRRSPHQREFVIYWYLRACLFIFDPVFGSSLYAFRACTVHLYVVKKK